MDFDFHMASLLRLIELGEEVRVFPVRVCWKGKIMMFPMAAKVIAALGKRKGIRAKVVTPIVRGVLQTTTIYLSEKKC